VTENVKNCIFGTSCVNLRCRRKITTIRNQSRQLVINSDLYDPLLRSNSDSWRTTPYRWPSTSLRLAIRNNAQITQHFFTYQTVFPRLRFKFSPQHCARNKLQIIIWPHRMRFINAAYGLEPGGVVCLSVGHNRELCVWLNRLKCIWEGDSRRPRNHA